MITKNNNNYYKISEVSQMTGIHLITLYKRLKRPGITSIKVGGEKYISEDSVKVLEEPGKMGRPKLDSSDIMD